MALGRRWPFQSVRWKNPASGQIRPRWRTSFQQMIKRLNLDEHGSTGCRLAIIMKLSRQINISLSIDDTSICSGAICLQCSPDLVQSLKWSVFENNFKNPNACRIVLVQRVWWSGKLSPTSCGTPTPLAKHLVQGISEGGSVYNQMIIIF